jgi:hypothetical protein
VVLTPEYCGNGRQLFGCQYVQSTLGAVDVGLTNITTPTTPVAIRIPYLRERYSATMLDESTPNQEPSSMMEISQPLFVGFSISPSISATLSGGPLMYSLLLTLPESGHSEDT